MANNIEHLQKVVQESSTYDDMFDSGGVDGVFDLPYRHSCYYPMYKAVERECRRLKQLEILEVGCGSGAFAHMIFDMGSYRYRGFDFSSVAVKKAIERTGRRNAFFVADALEGANYQDSHAAIVCTEVLEHIPEDRELVSRWPSGSVCVCTVPNFDSRYHERFFRNEREIFSRYQELIDIQDIRPVKKPVIADISARNFWRQLRWNRYRPRRLIELLGLGRFDTVGGWYLFSGIKR